MKSQKKFLQKEQMIADVFKNYMYQCKNCGHKEVIKPIQNNKLCSYCGNLIFKNDKDEFIYRINQKMKGNKK